MTTTTVWGAHHFRPIPWRYRITRARIGYIVTATFNGMPKRYTTVCRAWFPTLKTAHHGARNARGPFA